MFKALKCKLLPGWVARLLSTEVERWRRGPEPFCGPSHAARQPPKRVWREDDATITGYVHTSIDPGRAAGTHLLGIHTSSHPASCSAHVGCAAPRLLDAVTARHRAPREAGHPGCHIRPHCVALRHSRWRLSGRARCGRRRLPAAPLVDDAAAAAAHAENVVAGQAARAPVDLQRLLLLLVLVVANELERLLAAGLRAHEREHVPIDLCSGLGGRAKHLEDLPVDLHGRPRHAHEHVEGRPNELAVRV
mmetsp:Transcript_86364/g.217416  ORF Transcript_86364/g.217416 Transcript_86364/m.217416 type:complete len:248 (-) Transcript_86364:405-1148(-)